MHTQKKDNEKILCVLHSNYENILLEYHMFIFLGKYVGM